MTITRMHNSPGMSGDEPLCLFVERRGGATYEGYPRASTFQVLPNVAWRPFKELIRKQTGIPESKLEKLFEWVSDKFYDVLWSF